MGNVGGEIDERRNLKIQNQNGTIFVFLFLFSNLGFLGVFDVYDASKVHNK